MEKSWANLASRVVRVVLARKDVKPAELAELLQKAGIGYSAKTLTERISRGLISLGEFVCILSSVGHDVPPLWGYKFDVSKSSEKRFSQVIEASKYVINAEMKRRPDIDLPVLVNLMARAEAEVGSERLMNDIQSGELLLRDFLVMTFCLGSSSLDGYLCANEFFEVASKSVPQPNSVGEIVS